MGVEDLVVNVGVERKHVPLPDVQARHVPIEISDHCRHLRAVLEAMLPVAALVSG